MTKAVARRQPPVTIFCRGVFSIPNLAGVESAVRIDSCHGTMPGQLTEEGVDALVEDGDEDEDEEGVHHLDLVGQDLQAAHLAVHARGLEGPPGAL